MNAAQASLDLAKAQLTNAQNYLAALTGGTIPSDATGSDLANLRQAQLAVKNAQTNLDSATLYAPMSGTVMALNVTNGETISGNTTIMTIDDLSKATIQFLPGCERLDECQGGLHRFGLLRCAIRADVQRQGDEDHARAGYRARLIHDRRPGTTR